MVLSNRWEPLRPHDVQRALYNSPHRFTVNPAGRRSGKTELAKRKLVARALVGTKYRRPRFFAGAPTRDQAKRIYWDDLKALVPAALVKGRPSETQLEISLVNGATIAVIGLDKPERIEGSPWDGGLLDEYANMKRETWQEHVRPSLSDRGGWCVFLGVPEGRNHYYDLYRRAVAEQADRGKDSEWGAYSWSSADILPEEEIAAAQRDLDPLVFEQEYEASFVNFSGRAYHPFAEGKHCASRLAELYDPDADLILCFDFNVEPGVACVAQEVALPNGMRGTAVIGEVWIPQASNTPAVAARLARDWGDHRGTVICHGDAAGGARGSAQTEGSDWELVEQTLAPVFPGRLSLRHPRANPSQRARINAMNSRLLAGDGSVRLMVDPAAAEHVVRDLEGVRLLEGGAGELNKKSDPDLSHISDALGYYVAEVFPVNAGNRVTIGEMSWV